VPNRVVTALAVVVALGPLLGGAGAKETVTFCAGIDPLGKPEPVTFSSCTPGCPALGAAAALSVTCARAGALATKKRREAKASNQRNAFLEIASCTELVIAVSWFAVPTERKLEKDEQKILRFLRNITVLLPPVTPNRLLSLRDLPHAVLSTQLW
jgi:hypothetical protein